MSYSNCNLPKYIVIDYNDLMNIKLLEIEYDYGVYFKNDELLETLFAVANEECGADEILSVLEQDILNLEDLYIVKEYLGLLIDQMKYQIAEQIKHQYQYHRALKTGLMLIRKDELFRELLSETKSRSGF